MNKQIVCSCGNKITRLTTNIDKKNKGCGVCSIGSSNEFLCGVCGKILVSDSPEPVHINGYWTVISE